MPDQLTAPAGPPLTAPDVDDVDRGHAATAALPAGNAAIATLRTFLATVPPSPGRLAARAAVDDLAALIASMGMLSPAAVARLLDVSTRTVHRLIAAGDLPARRVRRAVRVPVAALVRYATAAPCRPT